MDNLPEIEGRKWVKMRDTMRSIPKHGFYITTMNENGSAHFCYNQPSPSSLDFIIYENGEPRLDIQSIKFAVDIDTLVPLMEITSIVYDFELEVPNQIVNDIDVTPKE